MARILPKTLWAIMGKKAKFSELIVTESMSVAGRSEGQQASVNAAADGAVSAKTGIVFITKGSIAALTLAAPVAGTDDGKVLIVVSATAFAHTLTQTTPGFNSAGTSGDVATFGGAVGDNIQLVAQNGRWLVLSTRNVTVA